MGCAGFAGVEDRISEIRRRDRRYGRTAYFFVLDALDHTMVHLGRDEMTGEERHIGGKELLAGIREFAVDQFGAMASLVFERWGIQATDDFGEIVFNLIDAGLLSRRPEDSRLDFIGVYDFSDAFDADFKDRLRAISAASDD